MVVAEGTRMQEVALKSIDFDGEKYYKISNHDRMRPFLMSVVSDSDHWMFISSNGGLSAGRKDADHALFPYSTDDKITESYDATGSKTILWVSKNGESRIWEPFSDRYTKLNKYSRNIYKNAFGNKIIFEEINHDLGLTFRYQWSSSDKFGFVRKSWIINTTYDEVQVKILDGIQNIMPHGVGADTQSIRSNLVTAYKRNELDPKSGLGIYALSAIIVDRAEPSEALKANIVWSLGLNEPTYLLCSNQLEAFRNEQDLTTELDVKAEKGAYFSVQELSLNAHEEKTWMLIANVNQGASSIAEISKKIVTEPGLWDEVANDIELGCQKLVNLVYASDGLQMTADKRRNARHYSNTLFNIMRGGIFDNNYQIEKWDFNNYLWIANKKAYKNGQAILDELPETFSFVEFKKAVVNSEDKDFVRLALEYLPLKFSRRHGDPSRPWNRFSINTRNEIDGSKVLDYEGNWRDIFQNWEALGISYPEFVENMILKFLNASTFDGYNPYRVTKDGFDWETIEADDPWSYIGYWGDHQIIYLLKFLEFAQDHYPNKLFNLFDWEHFVYADVPYEIKSYEDLLKDPKDTIDFNDSLDQEIRKRREDIGSDGALLLNQNEKIHHVNFVEKILATALAKLSNFVPGAGIWLNTQRPEWNDANNALVGNGVSMVTLFYLRRFFSFLENLLANDAEGKEVAISEELHLFFTEVNESLQENQVLLEKSISDKQRKQILDRLGIAGSNYRNQIYKQSFSGKKKSISLKEISSFTNLTLAYLDHTIDTNMRDDDMYHAYNLITIHDDKISISRLDEMLEGQVAALSSGYLSSEDCLSVLDAMKESKLFREDQYSYLLYPNKDLPGFLQKNNIPKEKVEKSPLLKQLIEDGDKRIIECDVNGLYHFNGDFKNAADLENALEDLSNGSDEGHEEVLKIFEDVFNHKAFTGRSGTFFGYEGLGSIYWHMVSKLLLAVEECCLKAVEEGQSDEIIGRLLEHYYEINEGIGVHKSPELYGAFPTDPYSHTPMGKGVQQPGMTGQVKEDILSRMGELGVIVKNGAIQFNPFLLRIGEFLKEPATFEYVDIKQNRRSISLIKNTLAFTYCQVPVIYNVSDKDCVEVQYLDGDSNIQTGLELSENISKHLFKRTGEIQSIKVDINKTHLK